jgi:penicillin amidase
MRALRWIGSTVLLLLIAIFGVILWYRQASQPMHEGTLAVAGLANQVQVRRDANAVPHIRASSEADALFALGYVHAQDRLWQMDFNRRIARGRIAEIAGPSAVDGDRFLRTLSVYRTAQAIAAGLDGETRALLDAYAAGVNAYLGARKGPLPPEFQLTRAPAPENWQAADSIAWAIMMAWDLSRTYRDELARLRLAARFTKAEIDEFRPPYPGDAPPQTVDYPDIYRVLGLLRAADGSVLDQATKLAQLHPVAGFGDGEGVGSNNWVVAGHLTASGKPLLANDPHLGLSAPSVWHFARLQAPGLDVFGAALPGVPYIVLGRNRRVAWGFTNTGADLQDVYIERINPGDPNEYQTPDGYARFDTHTETIRVKGGDDITLTVRATRHGPVISDAIPNLPLDAARYVLALRWTALEREDRTLAALRAMNRADGAQAFEAALADFKMLVQNIVFADADGNIGFVAAGRIPLRRPDNDLHGAAPAPGWDAKYDWQGWLPFADLPRSLNPPAGAIVTANHKIVAPDYPHYVTSDWSHLPYRANRISQLLQATGKHDVATFRRIQGDTVSLAARDQLEALRALQPAPQTNAGKLALQRLLAWDGATRADAVEPLLLHAWLRTLRARIFDDDLGDLARDFVASSELTQATLRVLRGETTARDWCDDRSTPNRRETCAELATEALDAAVVELAEQSGRDPLTLKWGEAHRARLDHRPLSKVPVLRDWFDLAVPYPGDSYTVNVGQLGLRAGKDWRDPYVTRHAASLRAIYDLADGGGLWIYGGGQVGHPLSDRYSDLLDAWRKVDYEPLRWRQADQRNALTLTLRPLPRRVADAPAAPAR